MGDAVVLVFGHPKAHEDDAVRAVLTAIDLHDTVDDLRTSFHAQTGHAFSMHTGINSGIIVTSDDPTDRASGPLGDMVNVAARLQGLAGPGEIFIGPETRRLVADHVALTDLGSHELKGRQEPVLVARVDAAATPSPLARPSRRVGEFVGRQEELGVLLGAVERLRDGEASVISTCAEAGAGKSRLVEELRAQVDPDVQWLEGRSYPYTVDIPYAPLIDLINRALDIDEHDSKRDVSDKLGSAVGLLLPGDKRAIATIGQVYGSTATDEMVDLEAFRSELLRVVGALIDRLAERAPTVICLQDLHWADPSSSDLVRALPGALEQPVVMICNYRPGFDLGVDGERRVDLGLLTERQSTEQLRSLLGGDDPPVALASWVADRAEGNPFFVEELVNALIDRAVLVREADEWTLASSLDDDTVPATIRGLLAARIDDLSSADRQVLREASVVGREFLYRLVHSVTSRPDDLDRTLTALSGADLIRLHSESTELEYVFKHALTQEVAYDGLLRRDRQVLHRNVAEAIEEMLGDRVDELVETLAYHYERSGDVDKAVSYLRRSARKAFDRYAIEEAHRHYQTAHDLLLSDEPIDRNDPVRARTLVETVLEWATAHYYTGELAELRALLDRHATLLQAADDPVLTARWAAWDGMVWWLLGDLKTANERMNHAIALAQECDDVTAQAFAYSWLTWVGWVGIDTERSVDAWAQLEPLIPLVPDRHDRNYVRIKGLGGAGTALAILGRSDDARRFSRELRDLGEQGGSRRALAMADATDLAISWTLGDFDDAVGHAQDAIDRSADPVYACYAEVGLTGSALVGGEPIDRARRAYESGHETPEAGGLALFQTFYRMFESQLAVLEGDLSRGMRSLEELRAEGTRLHSGWMTAQIDMFVATVQARVATGEAKRSAGTVIRNPRFVVKHRIGAAKKALQAIERARSSIDDKGMCSLHAHLDLEAAKLALHDGDLDDVRHYAEAVRRRLVDEEQSTNHRAATELLASIG